jgi:hypothetical protein
MIASDVAIARRIISPRRIVRAGTIRTPPTPKKPVIKPTTSPPPPARTMLGFGHSPATPGSSALSPRRYVRTAALSVTGTKARISVRGLTSPLATVPR